MRILVSFILGFIFSFLLARNQIWKGEVLGESEQIIDVTNSNTPSPTQTPTATIEPSPTQKPTSTPLPTATPTPQFSSEQIHSFIERFSSQYGVDPNVLRHIAVCESGFNSNAINGPYIGLYQFGSVTWESNRKLMGEDIDPELRLNPEESTQTAAYAVSQGKGGLWPNCYP